MYVQKLAPASRIEPTTQELALSTFQVELEKFSLTAGKQIVLKFNRVLDWQRHSIVKCHIALFSQSGALVFESEDFLDANDLAKFRCTKSGNFKLICSAKEIFELAYALDFCC